MATEKTTKKPMSRTKRIAANTKIRRKAVLKERRSVKKSGRTKRIASNTEIRRKAVRKERKSVKKEKDINVILNIVIAIILLSFIYFFVLTSTFAVNPNGVKPVLASAEDIGTEHINWILNEAGAYKLHPYFLVGDFAVISSEITDKNIKFTTRVGNDDPKTVKGTTNNPDISFSMTSKDFMELYAASNTMSKAQEMRESGTLKVEVLKKWFTLAVKGYLAIYTTLPA